MEILKIVRNKIDKNEFEPLFFFNRDMTHPLNREDKVWKPAEYFFLKNPDLIINNKRFSSASNILLTIGKEYVPSKDDELSKDYTHNEIWFNLEPFRITNPVHLKILLRLTLKKSKNHTDLYSFKELLWVLNNFFFLKDIFIDTLTSFNDITSRTSLLNIINYISYCLAPAKQHVINEILSHFGVTRSVYFPQTLKDALSSVFSGAVFNKSNINMFGLIRLVLLKDEYKKSNSLVYMAESDIAESDNLFINLRKWLRDPSFIFNDFEELTKFFRLLAPDIQLLVIRRYFEAIRQQQTVLDINILKSFKDNKFENWARYYHCAHTPSQPINLCIPLLCEIIFTAINSKGTQLITLNGIIDLTLKRAESLYPKIDLGLRRLFPTCVNNAVVNPSFEGFISLLTVYRLKEENFTSSNISKVLSRTLSLIGQRQTEQYCMHPKNNLDDCTMKSESPDKELVCRLCSCHGHRMLDKWKIFLNGDNEKILNLFTKSNIESGKDVNLSLDDFTLSPDTFKERLLELFEEVNFDDHKSRDNNLYAVYSLKQKVSFKLLSLIDYFMIPIGGIIEPKDNAYIGCKVLCIDNFEEKQDKGNATSVERQKEENRIIRPLIEKQLREKFHLVTNENNQSYIPFDADIFNKIRACFYVSQDHKNSDMFGEANQAFLISNPFKHDIFCAPSANNSNSLDYNSTVNIPFYRCRGKECYKSRLANQTLNTVSSWKHYSLLHILEILGFPQISTIDSMPVANKRLADTIAIVNKAETFFKRMTCTECGHLLFPAGNNKFNQYNYFECRMPSCKERGKKHYLNYCFRCVTGLIDSRISAKCPDGWYICPDCQSCCDSWVYKRMAQRYLRVNTPLPPRIAERMTKAHNDSDQYFCYRCGSPLSLVNIQEDDTKNGYCASCNKYYKLRRNRYRHF